MRHRITSNRSVLAHALRELLGTADFDFIAGQRGLFSLLSEAGREAGVLRRDFCIYIPDDGR